MLLFSLAEKLGKTVDELLTGERTPLSVGELYEWPVYRAEMKRLQDEAMEEARRNAKR